MAEDHDGPSRGEGTESAHGDLFTHVAVVGRHDGEGSEPVERALRAAQVDAVILIVRARDEALGVLRVA